MEKIGRDIKAMLQQDMTGIVRKIRKVGDKEHIRILTNDVDKGLTDFLKEIISEVNGASF